MLRGNKMNKYYFEIKTDNISKTICICAEEFTKASESAITIMKERYKKFTIEYIGKANYIAERGAYVEAI